MAQILIEFGSVRMGSVQRAATLVLADTTSSALVLPTIQQDALVYFPSQGPVGTLWSKFVDGDLASLQFRTDVPGSPWLPTYGPFFRGPRATPWSGVAEFRRRDTQPIFSALIGVKSLLYVIESNEETMDLVPEQLSVQVFPWADGRLIRAALGQRDAPRPCLVAMAPRGSSLAPVGECLASLTANREFSKDRGLCAVGPLGEWSYGSKPIEFPDFTRGGWKTADPWPIVTA